MKPKMVREVGTVRYDQDDGWGLDKEEPGAGILLKDLIRDFDGKEVEITVRLKISKAEELKALAKTVQRALKKCGFKDTPDVVQKIMKAIG